MIRIPERIYLANLPTKIEKLDRLSKKLGGPDIFIKRDDQTGTEFSGNKVRKLEFSIKEAIDKECNCIITCGGVQSNHCRATAAVAVKFGMKCCLVLRGNKNTEPDGNLFLDKLFGTEVLFVSDDEYYSHRMEIMERIKKENEKRGYTSYIIPVGASDGIGSFGYYLAMQEIIEQEKELHVHFDCIILAVGSGGTYAGLLLAKKIFKHNAQICGFSVCDDKVYFKKRIKEIFYESVSYLDISLTVSEDEINIVDGYKGIGYALSRKEELQFIYDFAKLEGIILDPVYTGKAMYGLTEEIRKGHFNNFKNILFIHTGGLFGLFPQKKLFEF
ncbi:MAG: D-cysteine desulfhydrase family protein [Bacteroidales bacterium]